jgi:predicted RNA-binding protein YlqC (UPF0109 family)
MQQFTPEEHATVHAVSSLMARTMALPAHDRHAVTIARTQLMGPRHVQISIASAAADVPLIIGGKGTNAKTVRELSIGALPPGGFIETHLEVPDAPQDRQHRDFGDLSELPDDLVREITEVVVEWHKHLGGVAPEVRFESTPRCDIWLVQGRGIPGAAMGSLRRVIGWACKVRGRNGFIEWESPR